MNGHRLLRGASHSLAGIAIATVAVAAGPPPNLVDMHPHGGQQGRALRLVIEGYGVVGEMEIESTLPGSFARLGEAAEADRLQKQRRPNDRNLQAAVFLVEIDADAAPGLYPLRAISEDGLSNALLFRVDTVSEVSERSLRDGVRSSSAAAEPPRINALPVVVNGTLDGAERDRYRFQAGPDERIVLEVEARRVGSAIDPVLRLLDSEGSEIAFNQEGPGIDVDARLDWEPPEAGEYVVEVHDARFSDQRRNFYRLKLIAAANYEYADAVFPLGARRGEETRFELSGGTVAATDETPGAGTPARAATAAAPSSARWARRTVTHAASRASRFDIVGPATGAAAGSAALPFPVLVSDLPEVLEEETNPAGALTAPVVVNGRIDEAGEVDRYRITAEPGQRLLIKVEGATLGSSDLFGVLTVTTPDGEYLASSGDDIPDPDTFRLLSPTATSFDPWVMVETPEGADELHVTVEDLVGRGGPRFGYRLTATANGPDFELRLSTAQLTLNSGASKPIEVGAVRRGYLGPIRLYVEEPPAGIEARDGWITREVRDLDTRTLARSGRILVTADLDAPRQRFDLEIWGEAVLEDGAVIRRRATVPGSTTAVRAGDGRSYTTEAERSFSAPWLETRLPVLLTGRTGPRLVGLASETVRLVKGMPFDFGWRFEAPPGEDAPVNPPMVVSALIGVGVGEFRVETTDKSDYNKSEGSKLIRSSDGTQHDRYTVTLTGEVTVGGRPERLYTPGTTLEIVPGYRIEVAKASVRSGRKGAVEGVLHREESFRQPVELRADALPTGVVCDGTEVEPEDDGRFRLDCEASDAVEAGDYDFLITSSSWLAGEREVRSAYTTVPVSARLEVKGR
ncbi:MAG: hypothetical protein F4210_15190 [Holophagales bacterium]|nr:hypothetical protein [Holophagales bacterium]MYF96816.1 hypothetical protein [Holophagales bacterium]